MISQFRGVHCGEAKYVFNPIASYSACYECDVLWSAFVFRSEVGHRFLIIFIGFCVEVYLIKMMTAKKRGIIFYVLLLVFVRFL